VETITTLALWLEETRLAIWVGESDLAYPFLLSLHVVGLAVFAGLLTVIDLRLLGAMRALPYPGLLGPMRLAWAGLVLNAISGMALFASQASMFVENTPFRIKLVMIIIAAVTASRIHKYLKRDATNWDKAGKAPAVALSMAFVSLAAIASAIVAGRLIAYF
jgi:hypothetical protein